MSDHASSGRPEGQPRLDVHNTNVDQDSAEAGRCGTVDLRTGTVCQRAPLHADGCVFEPPPGASGP